ncbi:hypothetical protein QOZ91_000593 [Clostridium sardiniense]|nr:hypothetical protein [Clostridium sardiniense]
MLRRFLRNIFACKKTKYRKHFKEVLRMED